MIRTALTFFLLLSFSVASFGQTTKEKLERRKAQLENEIAELKSLQSTQVQKEKSVMSVIADQDAKIKLIEKLINNTQRQTKILTDNIYTNQLQINKLNKELTVLKEDYAAMILKAYKNRSQQSRIMFILSSDNFLQAYKRMQYMKQYSNYRKAQGEEIKGKMTELEERLKTLNAEKAEKVKLLAENKEDRKELEDEKKEQQTLIKSIQKDKKKVLADIKKRQTETKEIDRQIDKIVREAIAAANRKAAAESGATTSKSTASSSTASSKIVLTKEGKIIADNFKANKGKLPWPVEKGYMSMGFGLQRSPIASSVEVDHSWIEITTEKNAKVRSIFAGEVMDIQIAPLTGSKTVLVQHGDYISIYLNLSSVSVSKGDKVTYKQDLGTVLTNPATGVSVVKFMIMQNTTRLNPEQWIIR